MTYKNSVKILFSNFNTVWKITLYFLLIFAVSTVGVYFCVSPIVQLIGGAGFFNQIVEMYKNFITSMDLATAFEKFTDIIERMFRFIIDNTSTLWPNFLGIVFFIFLFNTISFGLSNMASCVSLHYYMGSMTKQGFFTSFAEVFVKNLKAQLCVFLVLLPFNAIGVVLFLFYLKLFRFSWVISLIAVLLLIALIVIFTALKYTLFASWVPTIVVLNYGIFKSLRVSVKAVFKRFFRVFGNAVGIVLTIIVLNMFLGIFTCFAGLVISIPISFMLYSVFGMVLVYEGQGMKYYVDIYNVITPNKKEVSDKLKDMKYVV